MSPQRQRASSPCSARTLPPVATRSSWHRSPRSPFAVDDAGALYVWSAGSILERWPLTRSAATSPPETRELVRAAKKTPYATRIAWGTTER